MDNRIGCSGWMLIALLIITPLSPFIDHAIGRIINKQQQTPKDMTTLDLTADTIDVRDIIARVEELEQAGANVMADEMTDEDAELSDLLHILDDLAGAGGDEQWRGDWYPLTLIHEDHFEDHARELAEDIGAVNRDATWPNNCIDWEQAADQLRHDYSEIDVEGTTYYYR